MTPRAAIQSATSKAAEMLGSKGEGVIAPGRTRTSSGRGRYAEERGEIERMASS